MTRRTALAAGLVTLLALTAGCTGNGRSSSGSGGSSAASGAVGQRVAGPAAPKAAGGSAAGTQAALVTPRIIRTATLAVQVRDVRAAAAAAAAAATGAGGYVVDAEVAAEGDATTTLKVPTSAYAGVLDRLRHLGTVRADDEEARDVTGQVVDVESRLATQRASVARVRALLARARTVGEVVAVESQLSSREADLESLEAEVRALRRQVDYATVTLTLEPPAAPAPARPHAAVGFAAGLAAGWRAFVTALAAGATAVGAVLPFTAAGLVVLAAGLALRRAVRRRPATTR